MEVLITGAAGNLGSFLARRMIDGPHRLKLLIHRKPLSFDVSRCDNVSVYGADLADPATLAKPCATADCIVHFAGVLFRPRPERFLPKTNVEYVENLTAVALEAGVRKLILISFPHVEGETTPENPATGRLDGKPESVHAKTRLAAERFIFDTCNGTETAAVALRPGAIYARGVLMVEAARWLFKRRLLGVWREPTWIHLLSLPDFLDCVIAAIENENARGVYNLGDDEPTTLQEFLDTAAGYWGYRKPWRAPKWAFYVGAFCVEAYATIFGTAAPLTRDFVKIGMVSYWSDTSRMKAELVPNLRYPSLADGLGLL
ncbi:MAG: NAD(P)-dependent oxidoreductase [Candidatus Coatesbacteria bacterium]|nr:MAG: NAD(P)-dependent oxidoreductase [Candidatus Coatesbacteria bacterium]